MSIDMQINEVSDIHVSDMDVWLEDNWLLILTEYDGQDPF